MPVQIHQLQKPKVFKVILYSILLFLKGYITEKWFLCLMAYQPSREI